MTDLEIVPEDEPDQSLIIPPVPEKPRFIADDFAGIRAQIERLKSESEVTRHAIWVAGVMVTLVDGRSARGDPPKSLSEKITDDWMNNPPHHPKG